MASARARASGTAQCPLKPTSTIPGGEAWAFTVTGRPSTPRGGVSSTYTHGRGGWGGARGSGTICSQDTITGHAPRDLVLKVGGSAHVSPGITRLGRLGTGLALNVTVLASNDEHCVSGTRGTVVLFASYYQGHRDSVQLHFAAGCASHDATYLGPHVVALIARNGHQVNAG
jgi:hypothetical protein